MFLLDIDKGMFQSCNLALNNFDVIQVQRFASNFTDTSLQFLKKRENLDFSNNQLFRFFGSIRVGIQENS